jgi:hypothetical protein
MLLCLPKLDLLMKMQQTETMSQSICAATQELMRASSRRTDSCTQPQPPQRERLLLVVCAAKNINVERMELYDIYICIYLRAAASSWMAAVVPRMRSAGIVGLILYVLSAAPQLLGEIIICAKYLCILVVRSFLVLELLRLLLLLLSCA